MFQAWVKDMNIGQSEISIKFATSEDCGLILRFIRELAEYEKLLDQVIATEETIREKLFGNRQYAEVIFASLGDKPVGFALFFHNFSTFLGKPGIYLEDLYVIPEARGNGVANRIISYLAELAVKRDCGRLEWWCLDWNKKAIDFYLNLGAEAMEEWTVYRVTGKNLTDLANKYH